MKPSWIIQLATSSLEILKLKILTNDSQWLARYSLGSPEYSLELNKQITELLINGESKQMAIKNSNVLLSESLVVAVCWGICIWIFFHQIPEKFVISQILNQICFEEHLESWLPHFTSSADSPWITVLNLNQKNLILMVIRFQSNPSDLLRFRTSEKVNKG